MPERNGLFRERIVARRFLPPRNGLGGGVEKRDQCRKHIAEKAGYAKSDVDTRPPQARRRQNLDAGDPAGGEIVDRSRPHQMQRLGHILTAIAQTGAAPQIENQMFRPVAVGLQMMAQHLFARHFAELERRRRRHGARIGGIEIAARGQHIEPSARRCAGGAGGDMPAIKRSQQGSFFRFGAFKPQKIGLGFGTAAKNMLAVLDGEILEVAQKGVDARQGRIGIILHTHARLSCKPSLQRLFDNQFRQSVTPAAIQPIRLRIFINELFQRRLFRGKPGIDQHRWNMADGHGRDTPLGDRRFAWIGNNERIDYG
ncbi:hypothetical protein D3C86_1309930 [compost metagenome]